MAEILDGLGRHSGDPAERLRALFMDPPAGLTSEGWIAVACNQDGSAEYRILPTEASNRVLNGELFCAALETRLRSR